MSEVRSLYFHIPFCLKKCRYCDFYSGSDLSQIPDFVSGLIREIEIRGGRVARPGTDPVQTLYFGGGTPSLLNLSALEAILDAVHRAFCVSKEAEITLEANPGTVDPAYLHGLKQLGINRLSLGLQGVDPARLRFLGRIHTSAQGLGAVQAARAAGFDNIGLDLIYGLPWETPGTWQAEMDQALALAPEHLSCYILTLEPGTPLFSRHEQGRFWLPSPGARADLFTLTSTYLEKAGYDHYEISNFARGRANQSRHNSGYWQMTPYLGFGPSAHSLEQGGQGPERSWNHADLAAYIGLLEKGVLPVEDKEVLTRPQQMAEMIMVCLRTSQGLDLAALQKIGGMDLNKMFAPLLDRLVSQGLARLTAQNRCLVLSRAGWARLDSIVESFTEGIL